MYSNTQLHYIAYGYALGCAAGSATLYHSLRVKLAHDFARTYARVSDATGTPEDLSDAMIAYRINLRSVATPSTTHLRDERIYS